MKSILCVLGTLLLAGSARAQQAPPAIPPDLPALLREAATVSPSLRAAEARLKAVRFLPSQAEAPPDPEASVAYTNDGLTNLTLGERGDSMLSLTWTQEVPYPGKLKTSGEVARREAAVSEKELARVRFEIASAVKIAYADLYRLDRTAGILEETQAILKTIAEGARKRYEVGQGTQESVLKAQTEILRLEAEKARIEQDRRAAEIRLNAAVGRLSDRSFGPAGALPEGSLPEEIEAEAADALSASPEVDLLRAAVAMREAGVDRARLDLKPDFVWSASYQYRGDLDPMVMGMLGLRLPVYRHRKQAQALLQAESVLEAARQDLANSEVRVGSAVRELAVRVRRADRLLVLFGQGVIPQARSAFESARASYGVGRVGFLDLLNDLTVLLDARLDLLAQETDRFGALAALEPLLGRELIPVSGDGRNEGGHDAGTR